VEDEVALLAKTVVNAWSGDKELQHEFIDLVVQLVVEQPFKIPFVAGVCVVVNGLDAQKEGKDGEEIDVNGNGFIALDDAEGKGKGAGIVGEVLKRVGERINTAIQGGEWREVKLLMKFLGGMQGVLEGEGCWIILQDLLTKAVDLQTENNEEVSYNLYYVELSYKMGEILSRREMLTV
jgi:nuclear cap-binding protein subunit 1